MEIDIKALFKRPVFHVSVLFLITGIALNLMSQSYLHHYINEGKTLPVLSDLILNNIPYLDVDYLYDFFSVISLAIFIWYVIKHSVTAEIPYFIILIGAFHMVRAVFIILTPFGNPPMFDGTESPFSGFSNYELGVYPSGHTGVSYLYFLMAENTTFRIWLFISFLIIVISLFLARGHYSIDILSGVFFAYAIKAFGDKHYRQKILTV
ncbi:MAG: phosphatase PAP2-related protein [Marinoscillum sp.]